MSRGQLTHALLGGTLLLFGASCSFDTSALDARTPCASDDDCADGVCVAGSCWGGDLVEIEDADAAHQDADANDVIGDLTDAQGDIPADTMVCTPGERSCRGEIAEQCSEDGQELLTSDCTQPESCEAGECTCVDGMCVDASCEEGARSCDGNVVLECEEGVREEVEECEDGFRCEDGACIEATCTPGQSFCAGDTLVRCDEAGVPIIFTNSSEHADGERQRSCADVEAAICVSHAASFVQVIPMRARSTRGVVESSVQAYCRPSARPPRPPRQA